MKRSLSHTTTKRKDDKNKQKQERKFEKRKNQNKKRNQNYRVVSPHSRLRHEDAIMNKHYYN